MMPAVDPLGVLMRTLVALGPAAVVPVGLAVTAPPEDDATSTNERTFFASALRTWARLVRRLVWPAALAFAVALALPAGSLAAALTLPWVLVSALIGAGALARFLSREAKARFDPAELAIDVGHAYLPVGGVWAFVHRADLGVLGFAGTAALLTAAHFHYAGFGACVLVGSLARTLPERGKARDRGDLAALALTGASVALLAIGITVSRSLEVAAAWTLVGGIVLVARLAFRASSAEAAARTLTRVSASAGVFAAAFAAHFATVGFASLDGAALRRMMLFHAGVNALGFVLLGLVARLVVRRAQEMPRPQ
jgi:hypothetical protein